MSWIESHHTIRNHPKIFKLCKELKIERAQAIGHLHMLWWWALENRETGDLVGLFPRDIAQAGDWQGDGDRFLKALQKSGWVGMDMRIHDWLHYAGKLLKERERGRFRRQSSNESTDGTKDSPRTEPRQPNQTKPNQTVSTIKPGLLSEKDTKIVLQDIAKANGTAPETEASRVRLTEIVSEIAKVKGVKNILALARHKALKQ